MPRRRRSRRAVPAKPLTTLLVLATLLIVVYACNELAPSGLSAPATSVAAALTAVAPTGATPTAASATPVAAASAAAGAWYRLYFTNPAETADLADPAGGIPAEVAATIDAAQQSVDVAVYEFDLAVLAEALVRADQRGVTVRMVTDTDTLGQDAVQRLVEAGIPVVGDGREALMHDKFVVVDRAAIWTGSMNFTRSDAYRNDNNFIYVRSTRLAQNYTREFEEMFAGGAFGPSSPPDTPHPVIDIDGTRIETYFSPDDGVARQILAQLDAAERNIYFMAFAFTRQDFSVALLDKPSQGVDVRGVFETRQIAAGADQAWLLLTQGGLAANVRQDGNPYNLHHKVMIVDETTVITGSYNFSRNAEESNDENVLIIHDPDIARAYLDEWGRVWGQAGG